MVGYLDITVGPMFSGKTKKLIRTYRNYEEKNIVAINHSLDTRYMDNPNLLSRSRLHSMYYDK